MKRSTEDAIFSELVRTRAKWTCERCGSWHGDDKVRLHCSHHITRSRNATRWDSRNASAHCASCHHALGADPVMHGQWITAHIGEDTYEQIKAASNRTCQIKKHDRADIRKTLKWQLEELKAGNAESFIGWRP